MKFMALGPEVKFVEFEGGTILYDSSRASNVTREWLDAAWWAQHGTVTPTAEGRGASFLIDAEGQQVVLRHYRRGGLMARVSADGYLWSGAERTRSFQEWHLLYQMHRAGLPVPRPIAAGYRRSGATYRADILLRYIPRVRSLATRIAEAPISLPVWVGIGRCLRNFHVRGFCHADLNAHNVLLGEEASEVWLIDFDRGSLRTPGWWSDANLVRLRRSLHKLCAALPGERFSDADWQAMLQSYFSTPADTAPLQATPAS